MGRLGAVLKRSDTYFTLFWYDSVHPLGVPHCLRSKAWRALPSSFPPALTTLLPSPLPASSSPPALNIPPPPPPPSPLQESLSASEAKCGELTREMTELRAALEATGRAAAEDVRAAKVIQGARVRGQGLGEEGFRGGRVPGGLPHHV